MTVTVKANPKLVQLLIDYDKAKRAAATWKAEAEAARLALLDALGYDLDDPKPEPTVVESSEGAEVFKVARGTWRGLNQRYLKEHHPDVYAECEASKATLTIKYEL